MVLSLAHKYASVSAPGHRGFLWHTIGHANANMGHMAHLSRLSGSTNRGISINKEPVGARLRNDHKPRKEALTYSYNPRTKTSAANGNNAPTTCGAMMSLTDKEDATMKKKTLSIPFPLHRPLCRVCPCRLRRERIGRRQRPQEREQGKGPRRQEDRLYLV